MLGLWWNNGENDMLYAFFQFLLSFPLYPQTDFMKQSPHCEAFNIFLIELCSCYCAFVIVTSILMIHFIVSNSLRHSFV